MHQMRKENFDAESSQKFKDNFHELFMMSQCQSITQFAQKLKMNRQSVDRYYNGERLPDLTSIIQICRIMNVSADWLLGLSDIKSQSADIKSVVSVLGISEEAASRMIEFNSGKAFTQMAESEFFKNFIESYLMFLSLTERIKSEDDFYDISSQYEVGSDSVTLKSVQAARFFQQETSGMMSLVLEDAYYDRINKIEKEK